MSRAATQEKRRVKLQMKLHVQLHVHGTGSRRHVTARVQAAGEDARASAEEGGECSGSVKLHVQMHGKGNVRAHVHARRVLLESRATRFRSLHPLAFHEVARYSPLWLRLRIPEAFRSRSGAFRKAERPPTGPFRGRSGAVPERSAPGYDEVKPRRSEYLPAVPQLRGTPWNLGPRESFPPPPRLRLGGGNERPRARG